MPRGDLASEPATLAARRHARLPGLTGLTTQSDQVDPGTFPARRAGTVNVRLGVPPVDWIRWQGWRHTSSSSDS